MTSRNTLATMLAGVIAMTAAIRLAAADDYESSPTSLNQSISVVPAPGAVTIDGDTKDWDLSAGVWHYNTPVITDKFSVWTHMMWDAKGIYFLARFADKSPMTNATMGKDFANSWKADCYQARVILDDGTPDEHQMHINLFYSTLDKKPYMIVKHGGFAPKDETGPDRPELLERFGPDMEKSGGKIAIAPAPGGYNMEAFWPWSYIRLSGKPLKAGESFVFGMEAMWGDATGTNSWPMHRLADGIKNDKVNRIFMFRARKGWGSAVLQDKGQLAISVQQRELHARRLKGFVNYDTVGAIPIKYDLPDEREVTIAIEDGTGLRVRNLFGQYPRPAGSITDLWDGLDDNGKPLPPGTYIVQVLDHKPISLRFFNSVYNAGTPPWATESGKKIWGADHGHPTSVAVRGDAILCCFAGVESGMGLLRCNADGIIQWCDVTETTDACMDDKFAYALSGVSLRRFNLGTGQIIPFDDALRSPQVRLTNVSPRKDLESSIAAVAGKLFVTGDKLHRIDPATGAVEASVAVADLCAVTSHQDKLVGLFADGTVANLSADGVRGQVIIKAKGVARPVRLTMAGDGRVAITDRDTNQVLVFAPDGKRVQAAGAARDEAERPAGKFVETDLANPLGAAFDKQGRLWIAEATKNSKRVTVWSDKGELQKSFWGAADYGAMAGFPITFDSTRFIAHGVEFQLDPNPDPKTRPTAEKPLIYHPDLAGTNRGIIYRYKGHEYAFTVPGYNGGGRIKIAKRDDDGVFQWCTEVHAGASYWSVGWARPDLTIISPTFRIFPLKGISEDGVPLYDKTPVTPANAITMKDAQNSTGGTVVMDNAGNISDGIRFHTVDGRRGAYPNRYGRHDAPAAQRGVLIAPFRTNGVVEDVPGVGAITALGGDRGEWFLMTMDGMYISSILQDIKGDVTVDETLTGSESFGGFIWRDEKNRVLVQLGGNSYRLMEVLGLETCRKQQLKLVVTAEQMEAGRKIAAAAMEAAGAEPKELTIAKVATLPAATVAGDLPKDQPLLVGVPEVLVKERGDASRWWRAALAHDGKDLLIVWQVADANPWKNGEGRFTHAFMGGDCVDVKLDVPGRGLLRVLVAPIEGKDTVIYFQQKAAAKDNPVTYIVGNNAANATNLDVVKRLPTATAKSATSLAGYSVTLRVPLAELGLDVAKVQSIKGVIGVIYSDPTGTNRVARLYWNDKQTGMVSDVPTEARIDPVRFGPIMIGK